VERLTRTN
jgi:hypothetical protein